MGISQGQLGTTCIPPGATIIAYYDAVNPDAAEFKFAGEGMISTKARREFAQVLEAALPSHYEVPQDDPSGSNKGFSVGNVKVGRLVGGLDSLRAEWPDTVEFRGVRYRLADDWTRSDLYFPNPRVNNQPPGETLDHRLHRIPLNFFEPREEPRVWNDDCGPTRFGEPTGGTGGSSSTSTSTEPDDQQDAGSADASKPGGASTSDPGQLTDAEMVATDRGQIPPEEVELEDILLPESERTTPEPDDAPATDQEGKTMASTDSTSSLLLLALVGGLVWFMASRGD